ncbi:hypothetical protein BDA96_03G152000 [Sorghum bicolor]|uniref:ELK domain-containing protein n=2 Tax=Sorghum bicolor TaxID=4558 RepID=A0A921RBQ1_SORBI|nr:hypothetical protein BDA96_03G152000 [Sorghum bicolor]
MLLKKYSGCLSRLRSEFLKKRKKGKLPKDARSALMDWWNTHYCWPYPTDRTACYAHLDRRWDRKLGRPNPRRNRTLDSRRELPWELFLCIKLVKLE